MQKDKLKMSTKGITLIALVVTIVVLLILAGVSISMLGGENGIITQARNSKTKSIEGEEIEFLNMAVSYAHSMKDNSDEQLNLDNIKKQLNNSPGENKTIVSRDGNVILVEYIETGHIYQINDNGKIEEYTKYIDDTPGRLAGSGTEEDPYRLESIEDLVAFSIMTNGGNSSLSLESKNFSGEYLILSRNLDFNRDSSYCDPSTTLFNSYLNETDTNKPLKDVLTISKGFQPVGTFKGNYNGNNKRIDNIFMDVTQSKKYAFIQETNGTIKNLTLSGKITQSNSSITGKDIAAFVATSNGGIIENCINEVKIQLISANEVGGIVGEIQNGKIINCKNLANLSIEEKTGTVAGIARRGATSEINFCRNEGNITGGAAGGIVGWNDTEGIIKNSCNIGTITGADNAGGIAVSQNSIGRIMACYNTGNVISDKRAGGICGYIWQPSGLYEMISDCYNTGNISGTEEVGGIIGKATDQQILHCYNTGNVKGDISVGGIIGKATWGSQYFYIGLLSGCYSSGEVQSENDLKVDKIIGWLHGGKMENCYFIENDTIYGYTNLEQVNSDGTVKPSVDYEETGKTEKDLYNTEFLKEVMGFGEFLSEEDQQINNKNAWIFINNSHPKLWWEK